MDWRSKVELFEEIRREYEFGVGTIAGVSKKLKVHRRMVREAIGSAMPKPRKKTELPRWKLASAAGFVDGILEADRKAPRKATPYSTSHLGAAACGVSRLPGLRADYSALCS